MKNMLSVAVAFWLSCMYVELRAESDCAVGQVNLLNHVLAMDRNGYPYKITVGNKGAKKAKFEQSTDAEFIEQLQLIIASIKRKQTDESRLKVTLFFHGALNTKRTALEVAEEALQNIQNVDPCWLNENYPIFFNWEASMFGAYFHHLFAVRQGRETKVLGWPSAPILLTVELVSGIVRAPVVWGYQVKNRWVSEFPDSGRFERNARETHEKLTTLQGGIDIVDTSRYDPADQKKLSRSTPFRFLKGVIQAPFQLMISPWLASLGTPAWTNYLRRTYSAIRRPEDFDRSLKHPMRGAAPIKMDSKGSGALSILMREFQKEFTGDREVELTLIGHSTGAVIVNHLIEAFPDETYRNIVYLASAVRFSDFARVVIPYLKPKERAASCFVNVSLDTYSESREVHWGITPSGSLLEWLDVYFTDPASDTDRIMGKWVNLMATQHVIPESVRSQMRFVKLPYDKKAYPQEHGAVNNYHAGFRFWNEKDWRYRNLVAAELDDPNVCMKR